MNYKELRKIDVGDHVEKKNGLSYLSWSWAVDTLLQHDPMATWDFPEPKYYGETVMVFCEVSAFGKVMKMHLPVMDYKNQAVKNPDSRKISDSQMRCLAKCIACFGIGLYLYSGEDLPSDDSASPSLAPPFKPVKAEPKPEPKVEVPKAKVHVDLNGKPGDWQIKVADVNNLPAVVTAVDLMLGLAKTQAEVRLMFQTNKNIFDAMKENSPQDYADVLAKLKTASDSLPKE